MKLFFECAIREWMSASRATAKTRLRRALACLVALFAGLELAHAVTATPSVDALLTVVKAGTGSGLVSGNGGAIDCGATCSQSLAVGSQVTLSATADDGSEFTGWLGSCTGVGACQFTLGGAATVQATFAAPPLSSSRMDVDGSTGCDALTDGVLILRYLFGLTDTALIDGAIGPRSTRTNPAQLESFINDIRPAMDIDGNGQADALTDGVLAIRYLSGLRGKSLIANAIGPGALRTTDADIEAAIQSLCVPKLTQVDLQANHANQALIGPAGGSLATIDANGTTYSLTIPPYALTADTEIVMVPLASIAGTPNGVDLAAGVHLLPEGLQFVVPVTLTIILGSAPGQALIPFTYGGDLQNRHLFPAIGSGASIEYQLSHFSGYAAFLATDTGVALGWFPQPSNIGDAALQAIVTASLTLTGDDLKTAVANSLKNWLDVQIKPMVASFLPQNALSEVFLLNSLGLRYEMHAWTNAEKYAILAHADSPALVTLEGEFSALVVNSAKHAIAVLNQGCTSTSSALLAMGEAVSWLKRAKHSGVATAANGLDPHTLLGGFCVQAAYDPMGGVDFPFGIQPGQLGTAMVRAGYTVNGGPVKFDKPMNIRIGPTTNAAPTGIFLIAAIPGATVQKTFQWLPATSEIRIDVNACLTGFLDEVCQQAFIVRGTPPGSPIRIVNISDGSYYLSCYFSSINAEYTDGTSGTPAVSWSVSRGTFHVEADNQMAYLFPYGVGPVRITATLNSDPTKTTSKTIKVDDLMGFWPSSQIGLHKIFEPLPGTETHTFSAGTLGQMTHVGASFSGSRPSGTPNEPVTISGTYNLDKMSGTQTFLGNTTPFVATRQCAEWPY